MIIDYILLVGYYLPVYVRFYVIFLVVLLLEYCYEERREDQLYIRRRRCHRIVSYTSESNADGNVLATFFASFLKCVLSIQRVQSKNRWFCKPCVILPIKISNMRFIVFTSVDRCVYTIFSYTPPEERLSCSEHDRFVDGWGSLNCPYMTSLFIILERPSVIAFSTTGSIL